MLSDKIWTTRKCRINAEKRLYRKHIVGQVLVIEYSSVLVCMTIWNLVHPDDHLNIDLVIGSILVLILSIAISSQKYIERSLSMRSCYLKLDELCSKAMRAEKDNDITLLQQLESEYTSNLLNVENHSDYDYLCLRRSGLGNGQRNHPSSFYCLRLRQIFASSLLENAGYCCLFLTSRDNNLRLVENNKCLRLMSSSKYLSPKA